MIVKKTLAEGLKHPICRLANELLLRMDNEIFLQRIKAGELKALLELHNQYSKNLVELATYLIDDKFSAHDIVAESCLKIWEQRKKFVDFSVIEHCLTMATIELCKIYNERPEKNIV